MLLIDVSSAAEPAESFEWSDAVLGHLCANEDAKDSILMALLMPVVRLCSLLDAHLWDEQRSRLGAMHSHKREARDCWAHRLKALTLSWIRGFCVTDPKAHCKSAGERVLDYGHCFKLSRISCEACCTYTLQHSLLLM